MFNSITETYIRILLIEIVLLLADGKRKKSIIFFINSNNLKINHLRLRYLFLFLYLTKFIKLIC